MGCPTNIVIIITTIINSIKDGEKIYYSAVD